MTNRWRSQLGATAVEYALMVGLIAVVILGAVATLGQSIFGEDVEVLGNVLTRDTDDSGPVDSGGPAHMGEGECRAADRAAGDASDRASDKACFNR